ncbi:hypothetical protein [Paraflavitalea pollutisoli]|uniref:hypothetical protein n=1 Tax=Paraflavitalea pollutisoli TaxID=3034143 RepID=UPI0023EC52D5|nr:hypothetical protein [Paraflavitalea sp. H1-2-19X]
MKFKKLVTALLFMPAWTMRAQTTLSMTGEYYLRGMTEVASGFKLNNDSTFQFFFSYGALDRFGTGSWQVNNGKLVLNSRPQPEKDFAIVTSKAVPGNQTTIRIIDNNTFLLPYIHVKLTPGSDQSIMTDNKGMIVMPRQSLDSIALLFEFCPERYSTFSIADPTHNFFEFRFEPWLMEVFFKDFNLGVDNKSLYGKHPLLQGTEFRYNK